MGLVDVATLKYEAAAQRLGFFVTENLNPIKSDKNEKDNIYVWP